MKTYAVDKLLDDQSFARIRKLAYESLSLDTCKYNKSYGRYLSHIKYTDEMKDIFLNIAKDGFNDSSLVPTYISVARYQIVDGYIPRLGHHVDNLPCTHTIDLVIETTVPDWGLIVVDKFFPDIQGHGIFLKGNEEEHFRPEYPSTNPEDYAIMLFANFATPDHWSAKLKDMPDAIFNKFVKDGGDMHSNHEYGWIK